MSVDNLRNFFEPKGIVIVGARRSFGFGYGIPPFLQNHGWGNRLHLVNPAGGELHGQNVYKRVQDVPEPLDLAIVIVPAEAVPGVMEEIGERGIKHTIIETAGFAETGESGLALQEKVKTIAMGYGMRVIGPNCVGVINTENGFASVELIEEALTPGPVSIIAQSGVFGNILLDHLPQHGLFISKAVTLGNRLDVDESELLEYLDEDRFTRVIMIYLEGAANGARLMKSLAKVTQNKPVVILKSGRTQTGKQATASHTGSLSGQDHIYDAAFAQSGAIRADTLSGLIDAVRVFATQPLPKGNRLGIITTSGSLGALATDVAVSSGLTMPPLSPFTVNQARDIAPDWMNVRNPLDLGPSQKFNRLLPMLLADSEIDMVLAIIVLPYVAIRNLKSAGVTARDLFGDIASARKQHPEKPLVGMVIGHPEFVEDIASLCGPSIPIFASPEPAAKALATLWRYSRTHDYRMQKNRKCQSSFDDQRISEDTSLVG
ncbi:MAG TPA: CoA-binding protein [Thermodesulfobacteriota bacterium]|nr:CoA-binding protein [Thermodesulfobacteriota bacterium]